MEAKREATINEYVSVNLINVWMGPAPAEREDTLTKDILAHDVIATCLCIFS